MGDESIPADSPGSLPSSHFKAIFDHAPIGIALIGRRGRTLVSNREIQELTGFSAEELRGLDFNTITYRDDLEPHATLFRELMEGRRPRFSLDKRINRKDGLPIWVRVTVTTLEEGGEGPYALAMMEDITPQRAKEHALGLAQKMEAVGRLAGGVAHDFNNLLLIINNYAQMLRDDMSESDPRRADLDEIVEAGVRATRLVQQLLAFSREDAPRPQILSLNDVIQDLLAILTRSIGDEVEIQVDLAPDLWPGRIDPAQMEQVIANLADNARAAMPGGGTLLFRTLNVVEEGSERTDLLPGRYLQLEVTDNGQGIDPEILPKLFEPFFTTKPRGEGTGLGLATVYGIVDAAGGAVEVNSEPGAGATFRVLLPAAESDS